eukprot:265326_1
MNTYSEYDLYFESTTSTSFVINDSFLVNVYVLFSGNYSWYGIPFEVIYDSNGINWFDANTQCQQKYGTSLASIHSEEEDFLLYAYGSMNKIWIGLNDRKREDEFRWIDNSFVDYTRWNTD